MQIAIIVPVAQEDLTKIWQNLQQQLHKCQVLWPEVTITPWLVDDGVNAETSELLQQQMAITPQLRCLHLSRHFGYYGAVQAGLAAIQADAYIGLDPRFMAQFAQLPKLVDALVVGNFDVIGFACGKFDSFQDFALTAIVRRAMLHTWAHSGFALSDLAQVGFKQKRLAWLGPRPPRPHLSRWVVMLAVVWVATLSWTPLLSLAINVVLAAAIVWQLRWPKPPRIPYVVAHID